MYLPLDDKHLPRKDWLDYRNRIVSIIHGIVGIFLGGYQTYFINESCGNPNSSFESFVVSQSAGYFLYDLVAMAYFGLLDRGMLIHHMMCFWGYGMTLHRNLGAHYTVCGLFVAEISNPAMHTRLLLKHQGKRYTKAYEVLEITYILLYMYGRIILGGSMVVKVVTCTVNPYLI